MPVSSHRCADEDVLQDMAGLCSLQHGYSLRNGLTEIVGLCKEYVVAVADKEGCTAQSSSIVKALDAIGKLGNRNAKNKSQPTMQAWVMSWAKSKDATGELEVILRDDRWALTGDDITNFLAELRPVLQRLADPSRHHQALNFRKDVHAAMVILASDSHFPQVCLQP